MTNKEKENILTTLKIPIIILTFFLVLLLGKHFLGFEFGGIKKIESNGVEFFEPKNNKQLDNPEGRNSEKNVVKPPNENHKVKDQTTIVKPSSVTEQKRFKEIEVNSTIVDKNGTPIEGVEIWCKYCTSKKRISTDKFGKFLLKREVELKYENQQIVICFQYKNQDDCITEQYKYINNIQPPKFNRNEI